MTTQTVNPGTPLSITLAQGSFLNVTVPANATAVIYRTGADGTPVIESIVGGPVKTKVGPHLDQRTHVIDARGLACTVEDTVDGGGSVALTLYNKLKTSTAIAVPDTPMASSPTVTFGADAANSTVVTSATTAAPSILLNDPRIKPVSGLYGLVSGFYKGTNARMAAGVGTRAASAGWGFSFMTDAAEFDFVTAVRTDFTGSFRIYVDGQFINDATSSANNGDFPNQNASVIVRYNKVPLGSSKPAGRLIEVRCKAGAQILGINVTPGASVWAPPQKKLRLLMLGDSFTQAPTGATAVPINVMASLPMRLGQALGVDVIPSGLGGTGYIAVGSTIALDARLDDVTAFGTPDAIIVAMGINDWSQTASVLRARVTSTLLAIRAKDPVTPIFVLNAWFSTLQNPTGAIAAAIAGGFADAALSNAWFIDNLAELWVSDTGVNNAGLYVGIDGLHPTQANNAGNDYLAARLARSIMATLSAAAGVP